MSGGREYGRRMNEKGRRNEIRALRRTSDVVSELAWAWSPREATDEEEALGIDIVVESDAGPLWLQVKSSRRYAKRHVHRYGDAIEVVVVQDMFSDWRVDADIALALSAMRMRRLLDAA